MPNMHIIVALVLSDDTLEDAPKPGRELGGRGGGGERRHGELGGAKFKEVYIDLHRANPIQS